MELETETQTILLEMKTRIMNIEATLGYIISSLDIKPPKNESVSELQHE